MKESPYAFVIMPIGRDDLEAVYREGIVPAIEAVGLQVRRVNKHSKGGLLKSEIIHGIEGAHIVVGDLTHARQNVYLEVGYAMRHHRLPGGDAPRLILCARADHRRGHPDFKETDTARVHFDLEGYSLFWWKDASDCRAQLEDRLRQRLGMVATLPAQMPPLDEAWIKQERARHGSLLENDTGYMEFVAKPLNGIQGKSREQLKDALTAISRGRQFGILYVFDNNADLLPKALRDGVTGTTPKNIHAEGWTLRTDGSFYRLGVYGEDAPNQRAGFPNPGTTLYYDFRIGQLVRCLAVLSVYYLSLGVSRGTTIDFRVTHARLTGRRLMASSSHEDIMLDMSPAYAHESEYISTAVFSLGECDFTPIVQEVLAPVFECFDFKKFTDQLYRAHVNRNLPLTWQQIVAEQKAL